MGQDETESDAEVRLRGQEVGNGVMEATVGSTDRLLNIQQPTNSRTLFITSVDFSCGTEVAVAPILACPRLCR